MWSETLKADPASIERLKSSDIQLFVIFKKKIQKKPHTRDAPATPLHCRQWSNQILLSCGALLAVHDGLRFAVRVSGRFLRRAVFLCLP